jgi:hypothetical protein
LLMWTDQPWRDFHHRVHMEMRAAAEERRRCWTCFFMGAVVYYRQERFGDGGSLMPLPRRLACGQFLARRPSAVANSGSIYSTRPIKAHRSRNRTVGTQW